MSYHDTIDALRAFYLAGNNLNACAREFGVSATTASTWLKKAQVPLRSRSDWEHGTATAYGNRGCRCEPCKLAYRDYEVDRARKRREAGLVRHGTLTGYDNDKCRCEPCVAAKREHSREQHAADPEHYRRISRESMRRAREKDPERIRETLRKSRANRSPEKIEEHRTKERARHAAATPEQRAAWAENERRRIAQLDAEEREKIRAKGREYAKKNYEKIAPRVIAYNVAIQQESLQTAHRKGCEWTGPELEIITREDLTALEAAKMIGRTVSAVRTMRSKCRIDPRKIDLAGNKPKTL